MTAIETLRQYKISEYAIFDIVVSFLAVYLLAPVLSKLCLKIGIEVPKSSWLLLTLPLSIVVHLAVGTITPMTRNFFDLHSHYFLKILIIGLLVLGVYGIRMVKK